MDAGSDLVWLPSRLSTDQVLQTLAWPGPLTASSSDDRGVCSSHDAAGYRVGNDPTTSVVVDGLEVHDTPAFMSSAAPYSGGWTYDEWLLRPMRPCDRGIFVTRYLCAYLVNQAPREEHELPDES